MLKKGVENDALISKISNFVEGIRLQDERDNQRGKGQQCKEVISDQQTARKANIDRVRQNQNNQCEGEVVQQIPRQLDVTDDTIIQAERFKVQINAPKGRSSQPFELNPEIKLLRKNDNDDDFFHITCHVNLT